MRWTTTIARALWRFGGILVRPRATAAALRPDEGLRDGTWVVLLYVLAMGTMAAFEGFASLRANPDLGGALMMVAAVGRVLIAPIVVMVACETLLGRDRAYRRGLMLVPLLVVVAAAHELAVHGVMLRTYVPEIVGGVLSLALTWWVRGQLQPEPGGAA